MTVVMFEPCTVKRERIAPPLYNARKLVLSKKKKKHLNHKDEHALDMQKQSTFTLGFQPSHPGADWSS